MAYRIEKETGDIVIDGFEQGIAPSPHKGIGNLKNANISTELGEVSVSFSRTKQTQTTYTGKTLTATAPLGSQYFSTNSPLQVGTWINVTASNVQYTPSTITTGITALVVAGGGSGGGADAANPRQGGGGGAGAVIPISSLTLSVQAYTVTVGAGGVAVASAQGVNGANSSFGSFGTATGGGGGGKNSANGSNGGSGGGAGGNAATTGGTATTGGNVGGNGASNAAGAGGGGAGAVGQNASAGPLPGNGGNGVASTITGASVTYGGGGGGGGAGNNGSGGSGGGGAGSTGAASGTAGTANTGGGGGGASYNTASTGGDGGSGVVIISYPTGSLTATGGSITTSGGNTIHTFNSSGTFTVTAITAINMPTGYYYVSAEDGSGNVKLSSYYDPTATISVWTHATSGTLTYDTAFNMGSPVAYSTEIYTDASNVQQERYYVLDNQGLVFVYDTANEGTTGLTWFLPDHSTSYFGSETIPSGLTVLAGWLQVYAGIHIFGKPTVDLGDTTSSSTTYKQLALQGMIDLAATKHPHFAMTGHQGRAYHTDGQYIGSIFPDSSINSGVSNIQSYGKYTSTGDTGTITQIIAGSLPFYQDNTNSVIRIPVVFFVPAGGTLASALTAGTVYWLEIQTPVPSAVFKVYAAATGGSAIDITSGAVGAQYFNTYYPYGNDAGANAAHATLSQAQIRVNLPPFEVAQCMVEIGNTVLIGCKGSVVYPWNQVDVTPSSIINLPEANVTSMVTVNQMAYIFCGNQGNIYISDGSLASLVLNVPDYVLGVPGSPGTYIEGTGYFGGTMYLRGRVYFSYLDQTTTKTGNCGGIWSFVPTQNLFLSQDTGLALRQEAENSYATFNGVATILIPRFTQNEMVPLYWSGWYSSVTSPTYGIDYSNDGTSASFPAIIETDFINTGSMLKKKTFQQLEYKLAAPLDVGATVGMEYRVSPVAAWVSCGTFITEADLLAGYVPVNFEKTQWTQLRITLTPVTSSADTNSYVRLREVRMR